jgi:putative ABC transport system substrate-binding protein
MAQMKRREFIVGAAGAAVASPLSARAQPFAIPAIGFLRSTSRADSKHLLAAFLQGLREVGLLAGQTVALEDRYAENQPAHLPDLAADLIRRGASVIAGDNISAIAVKTLTKAVPIVFVAGGDPVKSGLVASINRPGGNVTGVSFFSGLVGAKRLELLRELAPDAKAIAVLLDPDTPTADAERQEVQAAALVVGQHLTILDARNERDLDVAFSAIARSKAGALLVGGSAFLNSHTHQIVAFAADHDLPAMYFQRESVVAGGLMSYGASITDAYRQAGRYAGRILKGDKPGDLPVVQATKFELAINLNTAKALGMTVPPTLLATADEVIE